MELIRTYKYKIRNLSQTKELRLNRWIGICRAVYNVAKETKETAYQQRRVSLSRFDLNKQLPVLKQEFDWIADVPSGSLQDTIERLDKSFQSFFKGGGYPKWAKKDKYNSITFKSIKHLGKGRFQLPKLGEINTFYSREIPFNAKLLRSTIIKENGAYYICVMLKFPALEPVINPDKTIGLDWGVAKFATLSNGDHIDNPLLYKSFKKQKDILQRSLARKKVGGINWRKIKRRLSKLEAKIARVRNDFQHNVSTKLASEFDTIVVEDLKIKNMTRSAKGTIESPGKNVKAKSGLNRSILDTAPGMFFEKLEYKAKQIIRVRPHHSSRECNECGHVAKENRKNQAEFECVCCGHKNNADINAALNILKRGQDNGLSGRNQKLVA